jgi:hypothetical protein
MAEQMIITLKQRIFELQQTYAVIQKEFELIAMHSKGTDTGYNEMSVHVKEVVNSLEQFYNGLNQENPGMYQDLNEHPETIKEIKVQIDEMEIAAAELQEGNKVLIDSIITGAEEEQTNSNQIKEE